MVGAENLDGRRAAGQRTRTRLLAAARKLVAERGREGVTLRAITEIAGANVAAVSYHFGSTEELLRATVEDSLASLAQAQVDGLRRLAPDASPSAIAAAWARPVIAAVCGPPSDAQALIRIAARGATDPSREFRERIVAVATGAEPELLAALRRALPGVTEEELQFRKECAGGILHFMATGTMRLDLENRTAEQVERLVLPAITGALVGSQ